MASRTRKANALLLSLALAASACTANPKTERPSFADDPQANEFIDEMVEKHGMDRAELEALFAEENEYFVYVKSGSSFDKRQVVINQKNKDYIIVQEGLEEGTQIAMTNPFSEEESKTAEP